MLANKNFGQVLASLLGLAYVLAGVIGFVYTGFSGVTESDGPKVFGLLGVNPFHNVIHLAIGGYLLYAATRHATFTEGALLGVGAFYLVAAISGFIYAHIPVISIVTEGAPDNYLHALTGLAAIFAGLISSRSSKGRAVVIT